MPYYNSNDGLPFEEAVYYERHQAMDVFDQAPRWLRSWLNSARSKWDHVTLIEMWERDGAGRPGAQQAFVRWLNELDRTTAAEDHAAAMRDFHRMVQTILVRRQERAAQYIRDQRTKGQQT